MMNNEYIFIIHYLHYKVKNCIYKKNSTLYLEIL